MADLPSFHWVFPHVNSTKLFLAYRFVGNVPCHCIRPEMKYCMADVPKKPMTHDIVKQAIGHSMVTPIYTHSYLGCSLEITPITGTLPKGIYNLKGLDGTIRDEFNISPASPWVTVVFTNNPIYKQHDLDHGPEHPSSVRKLATGTLKRNIGWIMSFP